MLSSLLQESSKFMGGVCYSMTKSLTLLGDGSSVDTPARLDTIFVTGAYARSWARRARTSDRQGMQSGGAFGSAWAGRMCPAGELE